MTLASVYVAEEIESVRRLHADLLTPEARSQPICDWLDRQAQRIADAHSTGNPAVVFHIACWHPTLVGARRSEILSAPFSLADARETIAREYGFEDWAQASKRVNAPSVVFENAVDLLLAGDIDLLCQLLAERPQLVSERSEFGHESTLLHYAGSNGVETWRQVVPSNLAAMTQLILDAGADVNATAKMYGGGSTTIGLLVTSAHPAAAGLTDDVASVLRSAGATE
jgi:hypothetical protein